MHELLRHWLWVHSGISVHAGKTKVWNRSGVPPPGCAMLQRIAASSLPDAVVWHGDHSLPPHKQGFKVLGAPFGHPEFVKKFLQNKNAEHKVLLDRSSCCHSARQRRHTTKGCGSAFVGY